MAHVTPPGHEIAAVLVSLPERHALLAEAQRSVWDQDRRPDHLLVGVDYGRIGEAENMNRLIEAAVASARYPDRLWLAFLHDDDIWHHRHLAAAEALIMATEPPPALVGRDDPLAPPGRPLDVIVAKFRVVGPRPPITWYDDWALLDRTNWFPPSAVVARASTFGLWTPPEPPPAGAWPGAGTWLDWSNWRRLRRQGAVFATTGEETMSYRFGPWDNGSWAT